MISTQCNCRGRKLQAARGHCNLQANQRVSCAVRPASLSAKVAKRAHRKQLRVQAFKQETEEASVITTSVNAPLGSLQAVSKQKLAVSWAGAGVFFFWQLGAMKYLAEKYDLTKVNMAGASGGSLAAVLAACGVDADKVILKAYELCVENNVWERPLGLTGMWGKYIETWLDELLPDNAHELCRNRITVVVTTLPDWKQVGISDFRDKKDLINCCMASSHVPFFLDYKLTRPCRGKRCVDGSFPDFFTGLNSELLRTPAGGSAVMFDYFDDTLLPRKGRMDMLEVKSLDEIRHMMQLGYDYAAKLHKDGNFDTYELTEVMLQGNDGHVTERLVPEQEAKQHGHKEPHTVVPRVLSNVPILAMPPSQNKKSHKSATHKQDSAHDRTHDRTHERQEPAIAKQMHGSPRSVAKAWLANAKRAGQWGWPS